MVKNTDKKRILYWQLARFFGLAFAISWLLWSPFYLPLGIPSGNLPYFHLLGSLGPMLAALLMLYQQNGVKSFRQLAGQNPFDRHFVRWLLIGFGLPVLLLVIAVGVASVLFDQLPDLKGLFAGHEFKFLSPIAYVMANIVFFGLGEEVGWRGFALPRLQTKYSAFTANLILTLFWAIWHWPLFFNPFGGYQYMDAGGVLGWLFSLVTGGIVFTWLFNSSRGNVLACALFHSMMDVVFLADLNIPQLSTYLGALITLGGLYVWLVYRPARLSRSPRVTSDVTKPVRPATSFINHSV